MPPPPCNPKADHWKNLKVDFTTWYETAAALEANHEVVWPTDDVPLLRPTQPFFSGWYLDGTFSTSWWGPNSDDEGKEIWSKLGAYIYTNGLAGSSAMVVRSLKPWHDFDSWTDALEEVSENESSECNGYT